MHDNSYNGKDYTNSLSDSDIRNAPHKDNNRSSSSSSSSSNNNTNAN